MTIYIYVKPVFDLCEEIKWNIVAISEFKRHLYISNCITCVWILLGSRNIYKCIIMGSWDKKYTHLWRQWVKIGWKINELSFTQWQKHCIALHNIPNNKMEGCFTACKIPVSLNETTKRRSIKQNLTENYKRTNFTFMSFQFPH